MVLAAWFRVDAGGAGRGAPPRLWVVLTGATLAWYERPGPAGGGAGLKGTRTLGAGAVVRRPEAPLGALALAPQPDAPPVRPGIEPAGGAGERNWRVWHTERDWKG